MKVSVLGFGDHEYARLHAETGYGNTIFSPLASGLLSGKYRDGIPEGSRAALRGYEWFKARADDESVIAKVERLRPTAERLGCSMAQLCLASTTKHPMISSAITGASRPSPSSRTSGRST